MTSALISSHCVLHFAGPRARKPKKPSTSSSAAGGGGGGGGVEKGEAADGGGVPEDKRPRTAFSGTQLARLKVRRFPHIFIYISAHLRNNDQIQREY